MKTCHPVNRKAWRAWLKQHHKSEKKVELISHKKHTGKPSLSHREAMEEAICFGWIDTTIKRVDENRYARTFVRRNKNSTWSNNTIRYAQDLIKKKKMTTCGLTFYEAGLQKPTHDQNRPKNPKIPADLKKALEKSKKAKHFFQHLAKSYQRKYLYWILTAKRLETRKKRIKHVVQQAKKQRKLQ